MLGKAVKATRLVFARPRRAWLMVRIATWTVVLSSTARLCSLPTALSLLSAKTRKPQAGFDQPEVVTAIDAVLGVNLFVFRPICWKRATLLHRFLGLRGCDTIIVFGLRKDPGGELKGHAWVEAAGKPILERDEPNYTVTYRFPSAETCDVDLARMLAG